MAVTDRHARVPHDSGRHTAYGSSSASDGSSDSSSLGRPLGSSLGNCDGNEVGSSVGSSVGMLKDGPGESLALGLLPGVLSSGESSLPEEPIRTTAATAPAATITASRM
ncbi:hypothetical protein AQJ91_18900 [Streptomyces dysideae]|uniref:Uncharacterized protein n=1 Tax=Streptomyces dysideae TaxID=909626 RepID=A0A101UZD1_9ACTN|nr:hypothetical protein AQJ91_18900 [Streptomyces dysideae]